MVFGDSAAPFLAKKSQKFPFSKDEGNHDSRWMIAADLIFL